MGMIIDLPRLVVDIRNKKRFSFDWIKFLASFPLLLIYLSHYFLLSPLSKVISPYKFKYTIMETPTLIPICGVIIGYIIITSFRRK